MSFLKIVLQFVLTASNPQSASTCEFAHRDPGMPNWIETAGHREGVVFCRWLQSEAMPEQPVSRVVNLR